VPSFNGLFVVERRLGLGHLVSGGFYFVKTIQFSQELPPSGEEYKAPGSVPT
jgi:hypothetical protein